MTRAARILFSLVMAAVGFGAAVADQSAVVLLYHRFGEDSYPTTNIRMEQLDAQITLLKEGGYHFMTLGDIAAKLKAKEQLPEKTVTIAVDDAYKSVVTHGWPKLKAAGIPMTLFVSTDPVDSASNQASSNYMTWDDVRQLKVEGVEIGHHTASHLHMPHAGLEAAMADVRRASERFEAELGEIPALFAYPYGEYDEAIKNAVKAEGFTAAFAQFSSPAALWSDPFALPRFPVNERYGEMPRFKLISQSMALPVSDVVPASTLLTDDRNPPVYGFTVDDTVRGLSALACYPSHLGQPAELIHLGRRVEVRFDKAFPKGRNRINCTLPAGGGRWYWHGKFFLVPGGPLD
ncbi:polysaccharide deacetylase family protein [Kordiimonas lacus]|uniref:Chitooligosaccharide deacetylase n=1 Tax=Kordiimonas lacus TaxID=637679 RepID=A0A1G7EB40_9PROT|nr:polysaccharide deacetylase family protein [Kordiimonas lacus]SDE60879.1 Polysaccharide deacetylase [Kordiimonas lacus]